MARKTKPLLPEGTQRLTRLRTAQGADVPCLGKSDSIKLVHVLLAAIDTAEGLAHETRYINEWEQRELPLRECRMVAAALKRCGAYIDRLIADRVAELPKKKP